MNDSKWNAEKLKFLDGLIGRGKGVRGMFGSAEGFHEEAFEEWKTSSLDFMLEELGEDNRFYKDFDTRVNKASLSSCSVGIGVLTALRKSLVEPPPGEEARPSPAEKPPQKEPAAKKTKPGIAEAKETPQPPKRPRLKLEEEPAEETPATGTKPAQEKPAAKKPKPDIAEAKETPQPPERPRLKLEEVPEEETPAAGTKPAQEKPLAEKSPTVNAEEKKKKKKKKEERPRPTEQSRPEAEETAKKEPVKEEACETKLPTGLDIQENILWQAQVQLSQGRKDAAAVLCGAVLEVALRSLCTKDNIPVKEWDTIGDLNDKLLDKGVYDEAKHSEFVSWWHLREDAAAVNFDVYSKGDVAAMIKGVHDFLKDFFPAPRN
ncbi:MAG: hypothetical protein J3T61_05415 [Candidatus Brocadiales bacterium]|nr:hypothetical protein [Candidatus Bathyanammoxibius sp.]